MLPPRYLAPITEASYLLRALGLELINALIRSTTAPEAPKPVLRSSRWVALSRCALHILTCGIFILILYLNLAVTYVGPNFSTDYSDGFYLALLQVAAKAMELACVGSLTTVVLHVLRHELIHDGIALGFVGSGLFFSQATCLWSPELIAAAFHSFRNWRTLRLLFVIGVAAIIAVLIAPASAVLLQPRTQNVPAGGTDYFIPAKADELWPSVIDGSDELPECFNELDEQHILCASGGFQSLRTYFGCFNSSFDAGLPMQGYLQPRPIVIWNVPPRIPRLLISGNLFGYNRETLLDQPSAIPTILLESLTQDWYWLTQGPQPKTSVSSVREYRWAQEYISSTSTTSPQVGVRCSQAQNISTSTANINFPVRLWTDRMLSGEQQGSTLWNDTDASFNVSVPELSSSKDVQISWIPLPTKEFGPVSGGVILQFPWEPTKRSRAVVGCSVSAVWIQTGSSSDSTLEDAAWSVIHQKGPNANTSIAFNATHDSAHNRRRLITLNERWYQSLTPSGLYIGSGNDTRPLNTIQQLFADVGIASDLVERRTQPNLIFDEPTRSCVWRDPLANISDTERLNDGTCDGGSRRQVMEYVLAATFVNGLSHYASHRAFNLADSIDARSNPFRWDLKQPPKAPHFSQSIFSIRHKHNAILSAPPGSDFVNQSMRIEVSGYAWCASSVSDYLAIAVVVIYMLIVTAYTIFVVFLTGVTSSSWDTVTELLSLAIQSPSTSRLSGSGAGVEKLATYQCLVRLRTVREEQEGRGIEEEEKEEGDDGREESRHDQNLVGQERLILLVGGERRPHKTDEGSGDTDHKAEETYGKVAIDQKYW